MRSTTASPSVSLMKPEGNNGSVANLKVVSSNLHDPQSDELLMNGFGPSITGGSAGGGPAHVGREWRGGMIALSPVSEEKSAVDTSDYGSDDLAFDALSDTSDGASSAGLPKDSDNGNSGNMKGSGIVGSTGQDVDRGSIQGMGRDTPDKRTSDDSSLSIDVSSSSD